MKVLMMADGTVGIEITQWMVKQYPNDLILVVSTSQNEVFNFAVSAGRPAIIYKSSIQVCDYLNDAGLDADLGLLVWWPKIIKSPLLNLPKFGFINTHPSLLPYNRGKHYNFWALVEQAPFGVTLHFVDEGIDTGDIVAQERISYTWEDNGGTLYARAQKRIVDLFKKVYPKIRTLDIERNKQDLSQGSFHLANEMDQVCQLDLEKKYRLRDLLNLLRARTFPGCPACWFFDAGEEYEVRIEIKRRPK